MTVRRKRPTMTPGLLSLPTFESAPRVVVGETPIQYTVVRTRHDLLKMCLALQHVPRLGYDVEATDLNPWKALPLLWQLSDGVRTYVGESAHVPQALLQSFLSEKTLLAHNANMEYKASLVNGLLLERFIDTMLGYQVAKAGLLVGEAQRTANLAAVCKMYLGIDVSKDVREQFITHDGVRFTHEQYLYAARDAFLLPQLNQKLEAELRAKELLSVAQREYALVPAFGDMELCGIKVDQCAWLDYLDVLDAEYEQLLATLHPLMRAGLSAYREQHPVDYTKRQKRSDPTVVPQQMMLFTEVLWDPNIDSDAQLKQALAGYGVEVPDVKASTIEDAKTDGAETDLERFLTALLDYSEVEKLRSTYGREALKHLNDEGYIYTNIFQIGATATGRSSSGKPINLMNIPTRSKRGKKFRSFFGVEDDELMIISDYGALEQCIVAHASQDPVMLDIINRNLDMHGVSMSGIFELEYEEAEVAGRYDRLTMEWERKDAVYCPSTKCWYRTEGAEKQWINALTNEPMGADWTPPRDGVTIKYMRDVVTKTCSFAKNYGGGAYTIMRTLKQPIEVCQRVNDNYEAKYTVMFRYQKRLSHQGITTGATSTLCGRKRFYFADPKWDHGHFFYTYDQSARRVMKKAKEEGDDPDKALRGFRSAVERQASNHPTQGCLRGDTRVLTSAGYLPIADLIEMDCSSLTVWTGTSWAPFSVLNRGEAQLADLVLANNQVLHCDMRHKVLVEVPGADYQFVNVTDLTDGSRLCCSYPQPLEFGQSVTGFSAGSLAPNANRLTVPDALIDDLWYMVGYYYGDGCIQMRGVGGGSHIAFAFGEHERARYEKIDQIMQSFGFPSSAWRRTEKPGGGVSYSSTYYSAQFAQALADHLGFDVNQKAKTKRIPTTLWASPLAHRIAFVRGLFDSDGTKGFENAYRAIHLANRPLLEELQVLVRTIGLRGNLHDMKSQESYQLVLRWTPYINDIFPLAFKPSYVSARYEPAPYPVVERLLSCIPFDSKIIGESALVVMKRLKAGGMTSLPYAVSLARLHGVDLSDVLYDIVPFRELRQLDVIEDTYTLSVDSPLHRFDSEGIISKNTAADIMKSAMFRIRARLRHEGLWKIWGPHGRRLGAEIGACLVLQVHDELVGRADEAVAEQAATIIREEMLAAEAAVLTTITPRASCSIGRDWSAK